MTHYTVTVIDTRVVYDAGYTRIIETHPDGTTRVSEPMHYVCVGHDHCIYCGRVFEDEPPATPIWKKLSARWLAWLTPRP